MYPEVNIAGNLILNWISDHSRLRRSAEFQNEDIILNITSSNQTFHIKIHPNSHLTAPGFKVYHRHGSTSTEHVQTSMSSLEDNCIFEGDIVSHSSKTALSLCGGVVSLF